MHSNNIFKIQKRIIRIINKSRYRDSCRQCLKNYKFYPCTHNLYFTIVCGEIHGFNTSQYQFAPFKGQSDYISKGSFFFFGIKLFNHLLISIKNLPNEIKLFTHPLKRFIFYIPFIQ